VRRLGFATIFTGFVTLLSGAAMAQSPSSSPPVTYGDVLAHPDDPTINLQWAHAQVATGDLKGAAATLERMLLIDPNQPSVRLFYAVVLYRLDSLSEAGAQFHSLDKIPMDAAARQEIDDYLQRIASKQRDNGYTAVGALGFQFDTNRNLAPTGVAPVSVTPALFTGPKTPDFGLIALGSLGVHHDLGLQEQDELTADITVYDDTQARVKSLNTEAATARVGGIWRPDFADVTANLVATGLWLGSPSQFYYQGIGPDIRAERTLDSFDRRVTLFAEATALDEIFHTVRIDPTAGESTGGRYVLELGANYRAALGLTLTAAWQGQIKSAESASYAYYGNNGILGATWIFAPGQYLQGIAQYGDFPYRAPDPLINPAVTREDMIFDGRATYGIGLDTLFGTGGPGNVLTGLSWSVSVEDIHDQSSLATFTNNDVRVLTILTKRLDF
jgi:hypothetical protein